MTYLFHTSWRVRFDEIDVQGVVHHSRIVVYLEIARLEFWRHLGVSYMNMRDDGFEFIVSGLEVSYLKPLHFDEIITVNVAVKELRRASFILQYLIQKQDGSEAVLAETELVCARVGIGKPTALPSYYVDKLRAFDRQKMV